MNAMPIGPDDEFKPTTAAEWLVALSEQPDHPRLRADFDAWLARDRRHAGEWAEVVHLDSLIRRSGATNIVRLSGHGSRRKLMAAALVAAAAAVAIVIGPSLILRMQADHVAPSSSVAAVPLADGSKVHLAPASAISVNFTPGERAVKLIKGEAFFDVTPDADRPFRVAVNTAQITVLGTAFDVRQDAGVAAIAVRHGLVQVQPGAADATSVRLRAGDTIRVASSGQTDRTRTSAEQVGAWTGGQLIVRERPVSGVIAEIRKYYGGLIFLRDDGLGDQLVTGVYDLTKPQTAVEAVAAVHGGSVRRYGPVLIISARTMP